MRTSKLLVVLIPSLLFAGTTAYPCGESMFRLGFGVTIPVGAAAHPAKVAIFKASKAEPDVFFDDAKVSSRLGKTGHRVALVEGSAIIAADPQSAPFDVVIARDDEIDQARRALGAHVGRAVFVAVHEGFARANDGHLTLSVNASLGQILGVLEHALQSA